MTATIGIVLHPRRDPGEVARADGVAQAALAVGGQRLGRYRCDGIVRSDELRDLRSAP